MMIPVMIVEDEFLVRVGLRTTIPWEKHGFAVVADAASAEAGLERYRQHHPHLILTDICMGSVDGLEMIRQIRDHDPDARFIIISAHSEFAYAQKAIRYGVDLYVDKADFHQEEIEQTLSAIATQYQQKQLQSHAFDGSSQAFSSLQQEEMELRGTALRDFLCEALGVPETEVYLAACRLNRCGQPNANPGALPAILQETLEKMGFPYRLYTRQGFTLALMAAGRHAQAEACLTKTAETIRNYVGAEMGHGLAEVRVERPMWEAFNKASHACNNHIFEQNRARQDTPGVKAMPQKTPAAIRQELAILLQGGQVPEATEKTRRLIYAAGDYRSLEQAVFSVVAVLEMLDEDVTVSNLLMEVIQMDAPDEMCAFFEARFRSLSLEGAQPRYKYVEEILAYIPQHLTEDLSLRTLAEKFHLSANYLGKLFYQRTGSHLNPYVASCRVNSACEILRTTSHPVGEVGRMVGIDNPYYFSRLFKERIGLSPHQYRSSLAQGE